MIDDVSIFGGGTKIISSDNFKGGNITAIFGGSEINLTGCKLANGDQVIDVLMIFGGSTIIVPKEWNVVVKGAIWRGRLFPVPGLEIKLIGTRTGTDSFTAREIRPWAGRRKQ